MPDDTAVRIFEYTAQFLGTFSRMCKLREPDDGMVELYALKFEGAHLSHLLNAFTLAYEDFKDAGRYPSPDEIVALAKQEKVSIGTQECGPLEVHPSNVELLQIFIKEFRGSNLKGKSLEDYLNSIVAKYSHLISGPNKPQCQICGDFGFGRCWFLYYPGTHEVYQQGSDGKHRMFHALNPVPNSPIWVQDQKPDFEPPAGQMITDGIFRCDCQAGHVRTGLPGLQVENSALSWE